MSMGRTLSRAVRRTILGPERTPCGRRGRPGESLTRASTPSSPGNCHDGPVERTRVEVFPVEPDRWISVIEAPTGPFSTEVKHPRDVRADVQASAADVLERDDLAFDLVDDWVDPGRQRPQTSNCSVSALNTEETAEAGLADSSVAFSYSRVSVRPAVTTGANTSRQKANAPNAPMRSSTRTRAPQRWRAHCNGQCPSNIPTDAPGFSLGSQGASPVSQPDYLTPGVSGFRDRNVRPSSRG
jgi:hypothetical protein